MLEMGIVIDRVEGRSRSSKRPAVEAELTGETESDELNGDSKESVGFIE